MNYEFILKDLKPSQEEISSVNKTTNKVIDFINDLCRKENIDAKAMAVGSVAKNTWLSGKSDIDIFIHFPLEMDIDELKEIGLDLAYQTNDALNGSASEHYASHPYLTCIIDGMEVDIVPCYLIEDGSQLKSAVDRTILHTNYVKAKLKSDKNSEKISSAENSYLNQEDEVLLLKKFMDCVGTYGSEFKTGGFAGYLCELLIIHYGNFEKTLREASNWKYHTIIDIEDYKTYDKKIFKKDPLVVIDPTDMNRNVGAALRLERMVDFIIASRNFLAIVDGEYSDAERESRIKEFFNPLVKAQFLDKSKEEMVSDILNDFRDRQTQSLIIKFPIPQMNADALHPQLLKTVASLEQKLEDEEFSVFNYDYWTDERENVIFLIELNVFKQSKYYIHEGPKMWNRIASSNFGKKWGEDMYVLDDFLVLKRERSFKTAREFIEHILKDENIHLIKVGKDIKETLCGGLCQLLEINDFEVDEFCDLLCEVSMEEEIQMEFLNFLDDFLNPGQYVKR